MTKFIDKRINLTEEQVTKRLEDELEQGRKSGIQYWPFFLKSNGEFIGCCGLRPYHPQRKLCELGIHIRSCYWNNGYAFEASKSVIDYAFAELRLSGLFAGHNPLNSKSGHLLRKLGFEYQGDEFYEATGLFHPSYLLTREGYCTSRS